MTRAGRIHRAARVEDWLHQSREKSARKRGSIPTVIPYTGYGTTTWARVFCRVLLTKPENGKPTPEKVRGWRSFTSVPVGDVEVKIRIGRHEVIVHADRGGVVDTQIPVKLKPGWHTATLSTPGSAEVSAALQIISPDARIGLLSDVDDTVMVTMLPRPLLAAWNTFVLDEHARIPTPGMAVLYERFRSENPEAPIIYLSTGAWNVAPTLHRFLSRNLYPAGPLLLTDWGPTHDRWFRSGRNHKEQNLRRLAKEFPQVRWVLVGDDGQHDIELYTQFAAEHPNSVAAIAIREMSTGEAVLAGGRTAHDEHSPAPVVYGPDGASIGAALEARGLLRQPASSPKKRVANSAAKKPAAKKPAAKPTASPKPSRD